MSDIIEKTLVSLHSLVVGGSTPRSPSDGPKMPLKWDDQWSKKFSSFVNALCSVDSKDEENKLVQKTIASLKLSFSNPGIKAKEMKEYLAEAIICELLGYPVPFVHIYAIKLADHNSFAIKRMGYLAVMFFLNSKHELILLLINTLQKDLKSKNVMEVNLALSVAADLMEEELIPSILSIVEEKLTHSNPTVRQKAASCIQCMANKSLRSVQYLVPKIMKLLTDTDPSVMIAALQALVPFIKADRSSYKHLLPSLIQVQEQIIHRKLPTDLNYHSVPAPWCQILLLRIFSIFGENDETSSNLMLLTLKKTLQQSDLNQNIAFGIVSECIHTVASIESSSELVELALASITSLLKSQSCNLKYTGLEALTTMITKVKNCFASKHQPAVIECLNHPDVSIRLKTLDLLYYLCNTENVTVICNKFIEFLDECQDPHQQDTLVDRILCLADKFSSSFSWYLKTVEKVLMTGLIGLKSAHMITIQRNLKKAKEDNPDLASLNDTVTKCVKSYDSKKSIINLTPTMIQFLTWLFQEYGNVCTTISNTDMQQIIYDLATANHQNEEVTQILLSCVMQLILTSESSKNVRLFEFVKQHENHPNMIIQQYALEIGRCAHLVQQLKSEGFQMQLLDLDREVDPLLSHQDEFVIRALETGAQPYCNRSIISNGFSFPHKIYERNFIDIGIAGDGNHKESNSVASNNVASETLSTSSGAVTSSSSKSEAVGEKKYLWTKTGLQKKQKDNADQTTEQPSANEVLVHTEGCSSSELEKSIFAGVQAS